MPAAELPVALPGRGGLQHRRQRFTVQRPPLAQIGGLMHPPRGLGPADPQPVGQHRGQLAAQHRRVLTDQLIDQRMLDGGLLAAHLLECFQHR